MATVVSRLESVLSMNTRDFDRGADRSSSKMHKLGHTAGRAGTLIAGGLAVGLAVSVKAAVKAEASQSRLATAFKTAGLSMKPYVKQIQAAETAGRKLGFTDDQTRQALGSLIVATKSYKVAAQQMAVAQDVARFKGVDLASATKLLTSASAGGQRALKQLGLSIQPFTQNVDKVKEAYRNLTVKQRENTSAQFQANLEMAKLIDKHKTMNEVVELVRQKLKGQSEAYAATAAGGMEQFRAQMDHLEVALGKGFIPTLTSVVEIGNRFSTWAADNPRLVRLLTKALAGLALALLAVKIQQLAVNLAVLANPYVLATVAIIAMSAALFTLWNRSKQARTIIEIVTGVITMGLAPAIIETVRHWDDMTAAIGRVITKASQFTGQGLSAALDLVHTAVQGLNAGLHAMKRVLDKIVDIFKWVIDKADKIGGAVGKITGAVGGAVGAVKGKLNPFGEGGPAPPPGALGPTGSGNMGSVIGAANAIDSKRFPYLWGGGHSGSTMNGPYDCSGAVSALLRAGGLMSGSMVSGQFMGYGKPGMGKHISILANPEHVYTLINGKAWGTSGQNPGGGAGWFSGGVRSGFTIRHPEGFDTGGWLKPGLTLAMNNTGRPERVLGPGEGGVVNFNFPNYVGSRQELMSVMREAARQFQTRNGRDPL